MEAELEHLGEIVGHYFKHLPNKGEVFIMIEQHDGCYKVFATQGTIDVYDGKNQIRHNKDKILGINSFRLEDAFGDMFVVKADDTKRFYPEHEDILIQAFAKESGDKINFLMIPYDEKRVITAGQALEMHYQQIILEKLDEAAEHYEAKE